MDRFVHFGPAYRSFSVQSLLKCENSKCMASTVRTLTSVTSVTSIDPTNTSQTNPIQHHKLIQNHSHIRPCQCDVDTNTFWVSQSIFYGCYMSINGAINACRLLSFRNFTALCFCRSDIRDRASKQVLNFARVSVAVIFCRRL